jgi:two-component system, NtrC family, response regulator AtoC
MPRRILVVDDDPAIRELVREFLDDGSVTISEAEDGRGALDAVGASELDIVLLDMRLPDIDGLEVLSGIRATSDVPVVVITADSSSSRTIRAIQGGAHDYLVKPLEPETLRHAVDRVLEHRRLSETVRELQQTLAGRDARDRIVGSSGPMQAVYKLIGRVADSDAPVLVIGETGTGKELVAETIHHNSRRRGGPLVRVNCAALPETLLESELFGHERGAFTGAVARRAGRFEQADRGTIFLDEVGDLSAATQKRLLRVLQFQEFERVGSSGSIKVDVRILAATNKDLEQGVAERWFREDLYYRLNVIRIEMPPLRERPDDIPALVAHFLEHYRPSPDAPPTKISEDAMARLCAQDWPGNVRQLENTIQRAVVMSAGRVIGADDLDLSTPTPSVTSVDVGGLVRDGVPLKQALADIEKAMIAEALRQTQGNRSEAARALGVYRRYLYDKMEEYGLA